MKDEDYPALFRSSDASSNSFQSKYLGLIVAEYTLLFVASVLSLSVFVGATVAAIGAFVFGLSIVVLLTRSIGKPEQDWYKARALAESVKTLTWRYIMRSHPFHDTPEGIGHRLEFKENLDRLFNSHKEITSKLVDDWSSADQITLEMDRIRSLSLSDRKTFYQSNRIVNQRDWYARKANWNRKKSRRWVALSIIAYLVAGALTLARIEFVDWSIWPIEPIIVVASSIIGWVQIKKFNELSAAYAVTAHEIGLIHLTLEPATTEKRFSNFVAEAELAFSREHTLWIARQAN